jgi:iron complex outermembrane receptor protein
VRYSDYEFYQVTDYVLGDGLSPPTIPFLTDVGPDRQDKAEDSVDWKLGLNWTVNDSNFVYGVVSRGHTTGSVNIFPPFQPYDEMEVLNYELGWKAEWADNRFTTQLSAYYENIEGYQAAFIDQDIPNSAGQVQNAASDSKIYGIELTGQLHFGAFSADFGASYNDSELGDFDNVQHPLTFETLDLTGAPFPFAPDVTANIGMEYRFEFGTNAALIPRFDFSYIADSQAELFDDPEFLLESRELLNLQLRYESGMWYAVAWMTNATDERFVAAIQNQGSLYYAAPPRQWGVRVGVNF